MDLYLKLDVGLGMLVWKTGNFPIEQFSHHRNTNVVKKKIDFNGMKEIWGYFIPRGKGITYILRLYQHFCVVSYDFLVWFYDMSNIVGYFMPNPLYIYILNIYDLVGLNFMAYQP